MRPDPLGKGGLTRVVAPTVWLLDLRERVLPLERWRAAGLVSEEELLQAERYRHAEARDHFLGGRALLRHALAEQGGAAPGGLRLVADESGKPRLQDSPWHFNLSHSGRLVACALAGSPVGIDVESTERDVDHLAIAQHHFSPAEAQWVAGASASLRTRFTALWTLKEAYLKAVGVGISVPLAGVQLSDLKLGHCRIRSADVADEGRWHCRWFRPVSGYWLAVCSRYAVPPLAVWRFAG